MQEWGNEGAELSELSIKELDHMVKQYAAYRAEIESRKESLSEVEGKAKQLESQIIEILQNSGKKSWESEYGKFSWVQRASFKQPDSSENRAKFYGYLKELGIFEDMVSVNSNTLTAWASKEVEAQEETGNIGWLPPGLSSPNYSYYLRKQK